VQVVEPEVERGEEQKEREEKSDSRDENCSKVRFDEEEGHIKSDILDEPVDIPTGTQAEAPTIAPSIVPNKATRARSKRRKPSIQWNLFFFP